MSNSRVSSAQVPVDLYHQVERRAVAGHVRVSDIVREALASLLGEDEAQQRYRQGGTVGTGVYPSASTITEEREHAMRENLGVASVYRPRPCRSSPRARLAQMPGQLSLIDDIGGSPWENFLSEFQALMDQRDQMRGAA